ncbi:MAG: hypothetical protein K1V80_03000 [Muribaculaceae bacterium]
MKPFELRLAGHHARNATHLKNLRSFVENEARFNRLSAKEQSLILLQIEHMAQLDKVLTERMKLHNLPI